MTAVLSIINKLSHSSARGIRAVRLARDINSVKINIPGIVI